MKALAESGSLECIYEQSRSDESEVPEEVGRFLEMCIWNGWIPPGSEPVSQ
jgi:hypothetical protein